LEQLLQDERYGTIHLLSRKASGVQHPKVKEHIGDLLALEDLQEHFSGDELYVCIGTTKKKTPDADLYRRIDEGIPVHAARLAKSRGVEAIAVVSAIGANSKSSVAYNRIKGDMEKGVQAAGMARTYILRPSIIGGDRKEKRPGEKFGLAVFKIFQPLFFGKLKRYRVSDARAIAAKMVALMNSDQPDGVYYVE
jgi:uncharacterized protein YbjT (DUF2867 family)